MKGQIFIGALICVGIYACVKSGCQTSRDICTRSHRVEDTCMQYMMIGDMMYPMYFSCTNTVCDNWAHNPAFDTDEKCKIK